jgi:hypothetical protein
MTFLANENTLKNIDYTTSRIILACPESKILQMLLDLASLCYWAGKTNENLDELQNIFFERMKK